MKKYISAIALLFAVAILVEPVTVHATFIKDTDPGGEKFYIIDANKDVSNFSGHVGANNSGPIVDVAVTGIVDTGDGYANIKPVKDGLLTSLLFTPADNTRYGDFSFRGQLIADGFVSVKVINYNDVVFNFEFGEFNKSSDFERIGVVSNDGDWFKSLEIFTTGTESFKEVKQIEFSYQTGGPAPVPEPSTLLLLGAGLFGLGIFGRRRLNK